VSGFYFVFLLKKAGISHSGSFVHSPDRVPAADNGRRADASSVHFDQERAAEIRRRKGE